MPVCLTTQQGPLHPRSPTVCSSHPTALVFLQAGWAAAGPGLSCLQGSYSGSSAPLGTPPFICTVRVGRAPVPSKRLEGTCGHRLRESPRTLHHFQGSCTIPSWNTCSEAPVAPSPKHSVSSKAESGLSSICGVQGPGGLGSAPACGWKDPGKWPRHAWT